MVDFNHGGNGEKKASAAAGTGGDVYLRPAEENRLVRTMLNPRRRWKLSKEAKQAAMTATLTNLSHDDARVVNGAVANLLKMEAQNQSDQHKILDKIAPDPSGGTTNQQINIYLPANGREATNGHLTNGHANGNGRH